MSIWLKVTAILAGAMLISIGISLIPAGKLVLSSQPPTAVRAVLRDAPLINSLFNRPPQATVDACLGSPFEGTGTLTHSDLVRLAKCLHRKHLVTAQTVAAAEKSQLGTTRVATLGARTSTSTWWWLLTWALALAAIAVVLHRHRRRG